MSFKVLDDVYGAYISTAYGWDTWDNKHHATSGSIGGLPSNYPEIHCGSSSPYYEFLSRVAFTFDTRRIGATATISLVRFRIYCPNTNKSAGLGEMDIHVCDFSPANPISYAAADIDNTTFTSYGYQTYANFTQNQWTPWFTLSNSAVILGAYTTLYCIMSNDQSDTPPTHPGYETYSRTACGDAQLEITYTYIPAGPTVNVAQDAQHLDITWT